LQVEVISFESQLFFSVTQTFSVNTFKMFSML